MPARAVPARVEDPYEDLANLLTRLTPAELERFAASLDGPDLAVLEAVLAERHGVGWRTDPAAMAAHLDATFKRWRYVDLLSRKFQQLVDGTSKRQIWNVPARYGKSKLGSQWGPAWCLDRTEGKAKIILVSYGDTLADENAAGVRDILRAHSDRLRCQLRRDRQRRDRFVTEAGGGVLAAGIDATITGFGAGDGGGIVVDDPFKNWAEAHSEARRDHVWNQYRGTLINRLDDDRAWFLVIHHRVHENDLSGRLTAEMENDPDGERWDVTALPGLAVADDPLGRAPGETLEPERFPQGFHENQIRSMGTYLASGLIQQSPAPEEGNEIRRAWFRLDAADVWPTEPDQAVTSWDLKLKDREAGDFVVGQCWWRCSGGYFLVDQIRGQFDHATTANAIALLAVRHPEAGLHVIEAAGSYDEVVPQLRKAKRGYEVTAEMAGRLGMNDGERAAVESLRRRGVSGLLPEAPRGDKSVRARTHIAPAAEAGDVHLPADAPWVPALLDELSSFPKGTHDDQVDAMSQALRKLAVAEATVRGATGPRPLTRPTVAAGAGGSATARRPTPRATGRATGATGRMPRPGRR